MSSPYSELNFCQTIRSNIYEYSYKLKNFSRKKKSQPTLGGCELAIRINCATYVIIERSSGLSTSTSRIKSINVRRICYCKYKITVIIYFSIRCNSRESLFFQYELIY